MQIKSTSPLENLINHITMTIATTLTLLTIIVGFTIIGVANGNISPNDDTITSNITRSILITILK